MDHIEEVNATTLLGVGIKSLREGRNWHAIQVLGPLAKKRDFSYHGQAGYYEAIATAKSGKIEEANKMFKVLKNEFTDPIMLRGKILKAHAEVKIVLKNLENIDAELKEAAEIFKTQGMLEYLGAVVHLEGVVASQRGELGLTMEDREWAAKLGDTYFPDFTPDSLIIDTPVDVAVRAGTATVLAGATI